MHVVFGRCSIGRLKHMISSGPWESALSCCCHRFSLQCQGCALRLFDKMLVKPARNRCVAWFSTVGCLDVTLPEDVPVTVRGDVQMSNGVQDYGLFSDAMVCSPAIDATCQNATQESLDIMDNSLELKFFSYARELAICANAQDVRAGQAVHARAMKTGMMQKTFVINSLIDMYSGFRMIDDLRRVFDQAGQLDETTWNLLLSAYAKMGWPECAAQVIVWMFLSGVRLNSYALKVIVNLSSERDDCVEVRKMLYSSVVKVGVDLELFVGSAIVDLYAKYLGLEEAVKIFGCIPNLNEVVYSIMISGLSYLGNEHWGEESPSGFLLALRIFSHMVRRGMRFAIYTYKSALDACKSANLFRYGMQLHARTIINNLQGDELIGNALVSLYSKAGMTDHSLRCFNLTPKHDATTWTSMISAYADNGQYESALELFKDLLSLGPKPDQSTISAVMSACSYSGVLRTGELMQCYALKSGIGQFDLCDYSLLNFYTNIGDVDASDRCFQQTRRLDKFTLSRIISCYAMHGQEEAAINLFELMTDLGVTVDDTSFLAVLNACARRCQVDAGLRYYKSMTTDYGLSPGARHEACIVDLLGRAKRLDEAESFITNSGAHSHPAVWHALLRACRFHGDKERGIYAAEKLVEFEPLSASPYVVIYNLCYNGKISKAMKIRGMMRERGVSNLDGISQIEIGRSLEFFGDYDDYAPEENEIFMKLNEVLINVRKNPRHAERIIWEAEFLSQMGDESLANKHGELMAVVHGLCSLPANVAVRVTKNQRISWESHEALKMLSEDVDRGIVIKDTSRFHHFKLGSCSCADYW